MELEKRRIKEMAQKLLLIVPAILIFGLGCDYATNYDILLHTNEAHQISHSLNQSEIDRSLAIIIEIADSYKLAQKTTIPKDIAHLHPFAVYRETDVNLVSGNISIIVYVEEKSQSLVININGLGPNRQNRNVIEEIKSRLYTQLCSEFVEKKIVVNEDAEIIKIAGE